MAKLQKLEIAVKDRLTKINETEFAAGLFEAHKTGTPLDGMFSTNGGVPKATNWMIIGDPGVGKCVVKETLVTIRIDSTGEIKTLPISDLHIFLK